MFASPLLVLAAAASPAATPAPTAPQLDRVWTRSLPAEGASASDARVTDVLGLRDGGVLVASARRISPTVIENVLAKFDANGGPVWENVFGSNLDAQSNIQHYGYSELQETDVGEILAQRWRAGTQRVVWFDAGGQFLTSMAITGRARVAPGGDIVVVNQAFTERRARDGSLVWRRSLAGTPSKHVVDALGNVFVFGRNQDLQDVPNPVLAVRITPAGDVRGTWCQSDSFCNPPWDGWFDREDLWNDWYQAPLDFVLDPRGHAYMLLGSVFGGVPGRVVAFDRTGAFTWSFEYSSVTTAGGARHLLVDADGSLRIVGVDVQGFISEYFVTRLDVDGNELWTRSTSFEAFYTSEPVLDAQGRVFVDVSRSTPAGPRLTVIGYDADGASLGTAEVDERVFPTNGQLHSTQLALDEGGGIFLGQANAPESGDSFEVESSVAHFAVGGPVGEAICAQPTPNSSGQTGRMRALGSDARLVNDLTLVADQLPANATTLFFTGTAEVASMFPGGSQGTLCAGGAIGRYVGAGQVMSSGVEGRATLRLDLASTPSPTVNVDVMIGETRYFQAWHRDANPDLTSNFTSVAAVTFQ